MSTDNKETTQWTVAFVPNSDLFPSEEIFSSEGGQDLKGKLVVTQIHPIF